MKVFLAAAAFVFSSISIAGSGFGETSHDFMPDEFLMKSFIRAHEATVSKRVNLFNESGTKWVMDNLSEDSKTQMTELFKKARVNRFAKVVKNDHFYSLKIDSINITFSTADLILDRIYVGGKIFEISRNESLPHFQKRLKGFLVKNRKSKKTSFLNFIIPEAHAESYAYNRTRVEDMVVLNASGIISVTYEVKWPWKKAEYAVDLAHALTEELNSAYKECTTKSEQLSRFVFRRMDDNMKNILDSMKTEGNIDRTKLISSLMRKFAVNRPVDAQSDIDAGTYKPINGECSNFDTKNPGIIQQMFPTMDKSPTDPGQEYKAWITGNSKIGTRVDAKQGVCDAIDRTVSCLENLEAVEQKNVANHEIGPTHKINFSGISVYEEVNGTKGLGK